MWNFFEPNRQGWSRSAMTPWAERFFWVLAARHFLKEFGAARVTICVLYE
jgi:hypothetical protein